MRIFMDTDCLYTAKTGVRTYVLELINALRKSGYEVIELKRNPNSLIVKNQMKYKILLHIGRLIWNQILLPTKLFLLRKKGDVLISPEYFTPFFCPIPNLVTIHDAVFVTRQEDYSTLFKWTLKLFAWPSARKAFKVLTVSNDAKKQISKKLNLNINKVEVTYLGSKPFKIVDTLESRFKGEKFFLYVGVLEKRKNLPMAIEAFSKVKEQYPEIKFYIVGQPAPFPHLDDSNTIKDLINDLNLQDSISLLGYVSDGELASLYQNALALIFISTYEGFGLPIIEGFSAGIPVLTSQGGATEEVAGGCSLLCNPENIHDIKDKMIKLVVNKKLCEELINLGKERASLFTWEKMSKEIIKIIQHSQRGI